MRPMIDPREDRELLSGHHSFRPPKPLGFLAWIVVYKAVKVVLAVCAAIAAFRLADRNLVEVSQRWLFHLGFDPDWRISSQILARAAGINSARLRWVGIVCAVYAAMYVVEAIGLYLELRWAEWFTVFQSYLLIPPEIYAIVRRPGPLKIGALLISLLMISYLLWRIRHDQREEACQSRARS